MADRTGPLAGVRIIELAGIGPGPMCAMILADLGATVIRIDRPEPAQLGIGRPLRYDLLRRSRQTLALDLKKPDARELVLRLSEGADGLIEGFRPGVTERLGLGPDALLSRNPRIVYGRMTGWGQEGPLAQTAGHDINYIAITGSLAMFGAADRPPPPPLNLVGDYAGGALYLALGMLSAILSARTTGRGQVVDAAIVDGVASMMTTFHGMLAAGMLDPAREANVLDGGAPYYTTYRCGDGHFLAVGPIEPKFLDVLLVRGGIDRDEFPRPLDRASWPTARERLEALFLTRAREEWLETFKDSDACVAPVLTMEEAIGHPHLLARGTYVDIDGIVQPGPAPRFSGTPPSLPTPPAEPDSDAALAGWLPPSEIAALRAAGTVD